MAKIKTHYDNLKVSRDAPPEVIKAAYRSLSQKYHPDRNPEPGAARIMAIINAAYEVLSDPVKRQHHDEWIRLVEAGEGSARTAQDYSNPPRTEPKPEWQPPPKPAQRDQGWQDAHADVPGPTAAWVTHLGKYWLLYLWVGLVILSFPIGSKDQNPPKQAAPYSAEPLPVAEESTPPQTAASAPEAAPVLVAKPTPAVPAKPKYVRPNLTPYGLPWPVHAAYLEGALNELTNGLSSVTVDNRKSNSDVMVKLVYLDVLTPTPVRTFFIPAYESFTLRDIDAGNYDIRYRDLDSGELVRSEPFKLEEVSTYNGVNFSNVTITLYRVMHGNMVTTRITEAEF